MRLSIIAVLLFSVLSPFRGVSAMRHRPIMTRMQATAYSSAAQPTASGTIAHEGIVAADPVVLPLGSKIRVTNAGPYSGIYTVTDTGSKINGLHIDIFIPSNVAAKEFGTKAVNVQVLERGLGPKDARDKDIPAPRESARLAAPKP
jgi:rare lipoprotein A